MCGLNVLWVLWVLWREDCAEEGGRRVEGESVPVKEGEHGKAGGGGGEREKGEGRNDRLELSLP